MSALLGLGLMAFGFALVNNFRKRGKDVEGWINISVFQDHFHWLTKQQRVKGLSRELTARISTIDGQK